MRLECCVAGYPAAIVTEAAQAIGAQLVPITGKAVGELLAEHRFLTVADIPARRRCGFAW